MKKIIEYILNIFFRKKALAVKKQAFIDRHNAFIEYAKAKEANDRYLKKFSGKKRYVKTGGI